MPEDPNEIVDLEGSVEGILKEVEQILALLLAEEDGEILGPRLHRLVSALVKPLRKLVRFLGTNGVPDRLVAFSKLLKGRAGLVQEVQEEGATLGLIAALKDEMDIQGLTVFDLARRLDCTPQNVVQHLSGAKTMLITTAEKIAGALGMRVEIKLAPKSASPV
jgi:hypothetical protein